MSLWIISLSVTIQMKATEQCFPACCIVYYSEQAKVFLTFNFLTSVDEILKCDFN